MQRSVSHGVFVGEWSTVVLEGGGIVILGADATEGGGGGITKGLVCQVRESKLYPVGYWGKVEGFEEEVL